MLDLHLIVDTDFQPWYVTSGKGLDALLEKRHKAYKFCRFILFQRHDLIHSLFTG